MMTRQEILEREFNLLREEIIENYNRKGMRASGNFERETLATAEDLSAKIVGPKYAEQLEYGRRPTTRTGAKGTGTLIDAIKQWIQDKNIVPSDGISVSSLAFLITRKIHREGYDRSRYGGVGLISDVVTPHRMQKIINVVGEQMVFQLVERLEKEFKTI